MCMSIGRAPKSSPPGIESRTSPQRVSSGPRTLIDALIRSTSSYGATGVRPPRFVITSTPGSGRCDDTPSASSSSPMIDTSVRSGTLVSSYTPSASRLAAISLSTEFLAPGTRIVPCSGPMLRTVIWLPGSVIARQYAPAVDGAGTRRPRTRTIERSWPAGHPMAPLALRPRDDVVLERPDGTARFVQDSESFTTYRRDVALAADGTVTERTTYGFSIPWFTWLFAIPVRLALARRIHPRRRGTPWWSPPDRLDPPAAPESSACSPRCRCRRRSSTRCSPRPPSSPPTTSGSASRASASVARSSGPDRARPADRRARRPDRATPRDRGSRLRGTDRQLAGCGGALVRAARGEPDPRPAARPRPRLHDRGGRHRGDAAELPGVCGQRAGDGERARRRGRRLSRSRWPTCRRAPGDSSTSLPWSGSSSPSTSSGGSRKPIASNGRTSSPRRSTGDGSRCWPRSRCSATCSSHRRACSRTATSRTSAGSRRR